MARRTKGYFIEDDDENDYDNEFDPDEAWGRQPDESDDDYEERMEDWNSMLED